MPLSPENHEALCTVVFQKCNHSLQMYISLGPKRTSNCMIIVTTYLVNSLDTHTNTLPEIKKIILKTSG